MRGEVLKIEDQFEEIATRTIDDRNRLTLGELIKGSKRVQLYKNERGEVLLRPVVEIPASEAWLFRNKEPRPQGGALKPKSFETKIEIPKQVRDDRSEVSLELSC